MGRIYLSQGYKNYVEATKYREETDPFKRLTSKEFLVFILSTPLGW